MACPYGTGAEALHAKARLAGIAAHAGFLLTKEARRVSLLFMMREGRPAGTAIHHKHALVCRGVGDFRGRGAASTGFIVAVSNPLGCPLYIAKIRS